MTQAGTHPAADEYPGLPGLSIRCGADAPYTASAVDAPITLGRELPAQIRIADPRVSRTHLLIEPDGAHWTVTDTHSTNGTYRDGQPIGRIVITDGLTVHLGDVDGIPVTFSFSDDHTHPPSSTDKGTSSAGEDDDHPDDTTGEIDPGIARAGAAAAARREELGFSQRKLSDDKVIGQSNLVAFERGRRWPRESTRAKLEKALQWAPGTLTRIRYGSAVVPARDDTTEVMSDSVRLSVLVDALTLHLNDIKDRIAALPPRSSADYADEAAGLLAKLRQVQSTATEAARGSKGSGIALLLSDVRRTYNDLIIASARSPRAPLSHRLYAARHHAELTVEEMANAVGVNVQTVIDAEADRSVAPDAAAALESVIAALTGR